MLIEYDNDDDDYLSMFMSEWIEKLNLIDKSLMDIGKKKKKKKFCVCNDYIDLNQYDDAQKTSNKNSFDYKWLM